MAACLTGGDNLLTVWAAVASPGTPLGPPGGGRPARSAPKSAGEGAGLGSPTASPSKSRTSGVRPAWPSSWPSTTDNKGSMCGLISTPNKSMALIQPSPSRCIRKGSVRPHTEAKHFNAGAGTAPAQFSNCVIRIDILNVESKSCERSPRDGSISHHLVGTRPVLPGSVIYGDFACRPPG
jgi:hypothetical protein